MIPLASKEEAVCIDRPFYFTVVLWGERFRNYFIDLCLPSLLASGNLPSLSTCTRSKFFVCTLPNDWAAIKEAPIFKSLEKHVDVIFIEIPPYQNDVAPCVHMGVGHRYGTSEAYKDKAYPFVFQPDSIFSNEVITRLQQLARQGVQLVLLPALRFEEELFFEQLQAIGIFPSERNGINQPIELSGRQLASMALGSMHSETIGYEWEAPYFSEMPSAAWWRVPGENGIVVHSMSWALLLFDFKAVPEHDTSTFDQWTIDGDYVYRNLGAIEKIHLVLDSDEMFVASWAPALDKPYIYNPLTKTDRGYLSNLSKRAKFNLAYNGPYFDPLKRAAFLRPIRWHANTVNEQNWRFAEEKAMDRLMSCIGPISDEVSNLITLKLAGDLPTAQYFPHRFVFALLAIKKNINPVVRIRRLRKYYKAIARRLIQAARGDEAARSRIFWRLRQVYHAIRGKEFNEKAPAPPPD